MTMYVLWYAPIYVITVWEPTTWKKITNSIILIRLPIGRGRLNGRGALHCRNNEANVKRYSNTSRHQRWNYEKRCIRPWTVQNVEIYRAIVFRISELGCLEPPPLTGSVNPYYSFGSNVDRYGFPRTNDDFVDLTFNFPEQSFSYTICSYRPCKKTRFDTRITV